VAQGPQYQPLEIEDPKSYFMRRSGAAAGEHGGPRVKPEPGSHGDNDMERMQFDNEGANELECGLVLRFK
jgi:hypothetical protein